MAGSRFGWLHFTDLHVGADDALWPNLEEEILRDIEKVVRRVGPIHAVFFTGDLTCCGLAEQFESFSSVWNTIRSHVQASGSDPILLAVPGNHDLVRPDKNRAALRGLLRWGMDADLRRLFWSDSDNEYRSLVSEAFRNWVSWSNECVDWDRLTDVKRDGWLPGDFAATLKVDDRRLGILGLNSAALQLAAGDFCGNLSLNARQVNALYPKLYEWGNRHDACFLLTHHDFTWLDQEGAKTARGEIARPGRFVLHLCGHRHELASTVCSEGGATPRHTIIGRSLFGRDCYTGGAEQQKRLHGYSAGFIEFGHTLQMRIWPREGIEQQAGHIEVKADRSQTLQDDEGTLPQDLGRHPCATSSAFASLSPQFDEFPFSVDNYLDELDKRSKALHISDFYVPLEGSHELGEAGGGAVSLDKYLMDWAEESDRQHLAVLGDYGTGKTWLCLRFALSLAERHRDTDAIPLPLVISFKQYRPQMDFMELVVADLESEYGVHVSNRPALERLLHAGRVVLILDGMDEMIRQLGERSAIVAYSRLGLEKKIRKVLLTCRTHYFRSGSEQREVLNPDARFLSLRTTPQFETIHVRPFDQRMIARSISRRFKQARSTKVLRFVVGRYNLTELCSRPVLLSLVCDSFDDLQLADGDVTSADLYEEYARVWLQRGHRSGSLDFDTDLVLRALEDVAERMFREEALALDLGELRKELDFTLRDAGLASAKRADLESQLRTCTFLRRSVRDSWMFGHRSFQEFFYARKFFRWEQSTGGAGEYPVTHIPVWQFIAEMALARWDESKACEWIEPRVDRTEDPTLTLTTLRAAAAYRLLRRGTSSARDYPLKGIMLDWVRLEGVDLQRSDLADADFHCSNLDWANLSYTCLRRAHLPGASLVSASLASARVDGADCRNTCFSEADLTGADLSGANLEGAVFSSSKLHNVTLVGAAIAGADFRHAHFGKEGSASWKSMLAQLCMCSGWESATFDDSVIQAMR